MATQFAYPAMTSAESEVDCYDISPPAQLRSSVPVSGELAKFSGEPLFAPVTACEEMSGSCLFPGENATEESATSHGILEPFNRHDDRLNNSIDFMDTVSEFEQLFEYMQSNVIPSDFAQNNTSFGHNYAQRQQQNTKNVDEMTGTQAAKRRASGGNDKTFTVKKQKGDGKRGRVEAAGKWAGTGNHLETRIRRYGTPQPSEYRFNQDWKNDKGEFFGNKSSNEWRSARDRAHRRITGSTTNEAPTATQIAHSNNEIGFPNVNAATNFPNVIIVNGRVHDFAISSPNTSALPSASMGVDTVLGSHNRQNKAFVSSLGSAEGPTAPKTLQVPFSLSNAIALPSASSPDAFFGAPPLTAPFAHGSIPNLDLTRQQNGPQGPTTNISPSVPIFPTDALGRQPNIDEHHFVPLFDQMSAYNLGGSPNPSPLICQTGIAGMQGDIQYPQGYPLVTAHRTDSTIISPPFRYHYLSYELNGIDDSRGYDPDGYFPQHLRYPQSVRSQIDRRWGSELANNIFPTQSVDQSFDTDISGTYYWNNSLEGPSGEDSPKGTSLLPVPTSQSIFPINASVEEELQFREGANSSQLPTRIPRLQVHSALQATPITRQIVENPPNRGHKFTNRSSPLISLLPLRNQGHRLQHFQQDISRTFPTGSEQLNGDEDDN
ncbi:hypothetical protein B0O99DRAFT_596086 [Bisporella sp. PMI_857]|nr:hypothetical protein B0O99DRAFT_596086 [Bisporella sp. PMI_857]